MFETIFSEHNKIWGAQKGFGVTAPECRTVSASLGRTVARKSSIGGLDILKLIFNPQHEQHLQTVQIHYTYFPENTHNRLLLSN